MSTQAPAHLPADLPPGAKVAIAAARFNAELVEELLGGCMRRLGELGVSADRVEVHRVPGAFELPLAARWLAQSRRFRAVICRGARVRGDTPHFDYVAGECARGIASVALSEGLPVVFGVLTTNTADQAWARVGGEHGHAGERA